MVDMPAITYRTAGDWGPGKGARLTNPEIDNNFYQLALAIVNNAGTPGLGIAHIDVTDNIMTIVMEDYSIQGPFPLPTASFRFRGAWQPNTDYIANDLFTSNDIGNEGLYFVNRAHTSTPIPFNPADGNEQGPYASFLVPYQTLFDIGFFYPAQPGYGIGDEYTEDVEQPMFGLLATKDFYLPVGLPDSLAKLDVGPAAPLSFKIMLNGVQVGLLEFGTTETDGTFSLAGDTQIVAGDLLQFYRPEVIDDTAYNLYVTIVAKLGTF